MGTESQELSDLIARIRTRKEAINLQVDKELQKKRVKTREHARDRVAAQLYENRLRREAGLDPLTGLINRRGLQELAEKQLRLADRLKKRAYLLFVDVDGLKKINDTFGHSEGDNALNDTTNILQNTFRQPDIIARIGGDEFLIIAIETEQDQKDKEQNALEAINSRLRENLDNFNEDSDRPYKLSLSIGAEIRKPNDPRPLDDLITRADRAMYKQKRENQE